MNWPNDDPDGGNPTPFPFAGEMSSVDDDLIADIVACYEEWLMAASNEYAEQYPEIFSAAQNAFVSGAVSALVLSYKSAMQNPENN
jgi:hypothetical protein